MDYQGKFVESLFQNAIIFLDESIGYINRGVSNRRNMVLAIINMQIAMELALKSSLANYLGIRKILIENQAQLSDEKLERLFEENNLKIKEYDSLKNFTKTPEAHIEAYNFEKTQYKYMERFQKYRNQILHSSYIFSDDECKEMEKDLIYVFIHILGVLMSDRTEDEYRKFVHEYLNANEYSKLLANPTYNQEFQIFLKEEYDKLYICPYCNTKTVTPYKYCARCLTNFNISSEIYAFVKCGFCGEEMVICDAVNIENNNNYMRGLCLNCGEDTYVYKCPRCHNYINAELFDSSNCHEGYCKFDS
jgi:hypothetical protein